MQRPTLEVAIALVRRGEQWLVALRRAGAHLGGLWEFPGGKLELGESVEHAAERELLEECAVSARALGRLATRRCDYEDRVVLLTPVICDWQAGEAIPLGSDACRWVDLHELELIAMPAVNAEILAELRAWLARSASKQ